MLPVFRAICTDSSGQGAGVLHWSLRVVLVVLTDAWATDNRKETPFGIFIEMF